MEERSKEREKLLLNFSVFATHLRYMLQFAIEWLEENLKGQKGASVLWLL